jgi:hypothetical protein
MPIYRQRPIKGGRKQVSSGIEAQVEEVLEREMRRFKASRAFVISTALADYFGVEIIESYQDAGARRERKKKQDRPTRPASRIRPTGELHA